MAYNTNAEYLYTELARCNIPPVVVMEPFQSGKLIHVTQDVLAEMMKRRDEHS